MSEVTGVEVHALKEKRGKIVAFSKITLNGDIVIDGLKIIDGAKGLFVGMPSTKSKQGTYSDVAYAASKELKADIQKAVLEAYKDADAVPEDEGPEDDLPF